MPADEDSPCRFRRLRFRRRPSPSLRVRFLSIRLGRRGCGVCGAIKRQTLPSRWIWLSKLFLVSRTKDGIRDCVVRGDDCIVVSLGMDNASTEMQHAATTIILCQGRGRRRRRRRDSESDVILERIGFWECSLVSLCKKIQDRNSKREAGFEE